MAKRTLSRADFLLYSLGAGLVCLGAGLGFSAWMGSRLDAITGSIPAEERRALEAEMTALARRSVDSAWAAIDGARETALLIHEERRGKPASKWLESRRNIDGLLHWGFGEIAGEEVRAWGDSAFSRSWSGDEGGFADFEARYLSALRASFPLVEARRRGVAAMRLRKDARSIGDWIAIGYPTGVGGILLVLLDSRRLLAEGISSGRQAGLDRRVLLGEDGLALAHSNAAFQGSAFGDTSIFREIVRKVFDGSSGASARGVARSIDGRSVYAAVERVGGFPLAVVAERLIPPPGFLDQLSRFLGAVLAAVAGLALLAWVSVRVRRHSPGASAPNGGARATTGVRNAANDSARGLPAAAPSAQPARMPAPPSAGDEALAATLAGVPAAGDAYAKARAETMALERELAAAKDALRKSREELALVSRFETEAPRLRDLRAVGARLAELVSRLSESPTLFFSVHEGIPTAILAASAGMRAQSAISEHTSLVSFAVHDELIEQFLSDERAGKLVPVGDYAPLAEVVLSQFGVAAFEAWPITGYGQFGRILGKPSLLGLIVLLHPGAESASRRESLSRAVRATGLVYENALLAQ